MPGVKIRDGVIIGWGAIVTKDVPPYSVVAGTPAKVIKKRFDQQTIDKLLELAWWEYDIEELEPYVCLLASENIDEFIESFSQKN